MLIFVVLTDNIRAFPGKILRLRVILCKIPVYVYSVNVYVNGSIVYTILYDSVGFLFV